MASCCACSRKVVRKEPFIECGVCNQCFHAVCVNMSVIEIDFLNKNRQSWSCDGCKSIVKDTRIKTGVDVVTTPSKQVPTDNATSIKSTLSLILTEIANMKNAMHENLVETNINFNKINEKFTAFIKITDKINDIEQTQKNLTDRISNLETRLDELDQKNKNNTVIVHGLKHITQAFDQAIIQLFHDGLNVKIQPQQIIKCFPVNQKSAVSPVMIKFNNRFIVDDILKAKSKNINKMKQLNNGNVYINEDLTAFRRTLLKEARTRKFKFLWTRNGVIMIRKNVEGPVVFVKSMADLNNFM